MAASNTTDRVKGLLSQAIKSLEQGSTIANKGKDSVPELSKLFPNIYNKKRSNESPDVQPSKYQTRLKPKPRASCRGEKKTRTVARKFVCLANKQQERIPTVQDKRALSLNNLGEKKIALPVHGAHTALHQALIDGFPKLLLTGGFELMFAEPGSKLLQVIPTGPEGNTVEYITTFIGQGRVYIRPIQKDIKLSFTTGEDSSISRPVLEELCETCSEFVPMDQLRKHIAVRFYYYILAF